MGFLRKIGRAIGSIFPGTGRHAARRAETAANQYAAEAQAERAKLEDKNKKERRRASQIALRGLRSKRSGGYFSSSAGGESPSYGSTTIG